MVLVNHKLKQVYLQLTLERRDILYPFHHHTLTLQPQANARVTTSISILAIITPMSDCQVTAMSSKQYNLPTAPTLHAPLSESPLHYISQLLGYNGIFYNAFSFLDPS